MQISLKSVMIRPITFARGHTYCGFGEHHENRSITRQVTPDSFGKRRSRSKTESSRASEHFDNRKRSAKYAFRGCCRNGFDFGARAGESRTQRCISYRYPKSRIGAICYSGRNLRGQSGSDSGQTTFQRAGNAQSNRQLGWIGACANFYKLGL